jgi:predicted transcriptional regulator
MSRRKALDIKKEIIKILKSGKEISMQKLERKVNTNHFTIKEQIKELEYFGFVKTTKHEKSKANGRPFTTVKLVKKP